MYWCCYVLYCNTSTAKFINNLLTSDSDIEDGMSDLKNKMCNSVRSKYVTYKDINPELAVHCV